MLIVARNKLLLLLLRQLYGLLLVCTLVTVRELSVANVLRGRHELISASVRVVFSVVADEFDGLDVRHLALQTLLLPLFFHRRVASDRRTDAVVVERRFV